MENIIFGDAGFKEDEGFDNQALSLLKQYLDKGYSFLICGAAGSGKTMLLEWLLENSTGSSLLVQEYKELQSVRSDVDDYQLDRNNNICAELFVRDASYDNLFFGDLKDSEAINFCLASSRVFGCLHVNIYQNNPIYYISVITGLTEKVVFNKLKDKPLCIVETDHCDILNIYTLSNYVPSVIETNTIYKKGEENIDIHN